RRASWRRPPRLFPSPCAGGPRAGARRTRRPGVLPDRTQGRSPAATCARSSSLQELQIFFVLAPFVGALRIQRLHTLELGLAERRQVPDEPHEAPARGFALGSAPAPRPEHPRVCTV